MKKIFLGIALLLTTSLSYSQNFKFALVTDIHLNGDTEEPLGDLDKAIEEINKNKELSFVLVTGDISEAGDKYTLQLAKDRLDKLNIKYYAVSGNHETKWSESGATDFGHVYGSENFEFEHDGVRFLGFNTGPIIRMMDGHVGPQDISWLKERLSKNPNQPTIVATHYPLLASDVDNWYEVTDAVRNFNVKSFVGGHYHRNKHFQYDGIPGFLGRSLRRTGKTDQGGYSLIEVRPDSMLIYQKNLGETPSKWGGISMTEKYYTADNSGYERPDFSDNEKYNQVSRKWMAYNPNAIYTSPMVFENHVYLGDDQGVMICYSLDNGKVEWTFKSDNRIVGTADVDKDVVVFGSADEYIYGLETKSGKLLWKIKADRAVLGSVTIENNVAYIGASDGKFRAIDTKTGKEIWSFDEVKGYIESKPLVYQGKVIFGAWDDNLYALDKATGKLLWQWADGRKGIHFSPAAVWPAAVNGRIFVTAPDRVMSAIDAETGKTIWRTAESMVRETIGLSADGKRAYSKTMQDNFVCYSTEGNEAQRLWITNVGYGYDHAPSMPVEKDGVVFGSTKNGLIFALDGKSGELLWKHKVGNSIINTVYPLSKNEIVFAGGEGLVGLLLVK